MKSVLFSFLILFSFIAFGPIGVAAAQFNDILDEACKDKNAIACNELEIGQNGTNPVTSSTLTAVNIISLVSGTIAVVVMIIAGITLTMSQGDAGKIKSSRDAIIYSVVGLIVIALSRTIIIFILNRTS